MFPKSYQETLLLQLMDCGSQDEVGACPTSTVKDSQCQGHPRLADPCVEYWTKWDEWTPGLKDSFQERHVFQMEDFIRHRLQVFMSLEPELIGAVSMYQLDVLKPR